MQLEYSQVLNGSALHDIFLELAGSKIDLMQLNPELDHKIKAFARAEEIPSGAEKVMISEIGYLPAYVWFEEETGTLWWYSDAPSLRLNEDCKGMFAFFAGLESVDFSGVQTSDTTDMSEMFYCCESLKNLDLSAADTSQVTSMRRMFSGCSQLAEIDLKSFDTRNVTDMEEMFYYCEQLKLPDVTGFDTSNVVTMRGMFEGCRSLESLNLSYFDTYSVTDLRHLIRQDISYRYLRGQKKMPSKHGTGGQMMMTKIMPFLWRWNNWVDKKVTHIKAWFTAAIDGEWDDDLDDDIIEKMWRTRCKG